MKTLLTAFASLLAAAASFAATSTPLAPSNLVFSEVNGVVAVEAEHFVAQSITGPRAFYILSTTDSTGPLPDADPSHADTASGGAYLEILPDTRATHDDKLIKGENFTNLPGGIAVLSYRVNFTTPGRYYFWARTFSTGPEDNGMHVGLNGTWPESGQRWQTVKKRAWQWDCKQRTAEVHAGVPMQLFLDVPSTGEHTVQISMREDGFEIDKWVMARDIAFIPEDEGPAPVVHAGTLPPPFPSVASVTPVAAELPAPTVLEAKDFFLQSTDYYFDKGKWAAVNPEKHKKASVTTLVPVGNARYDVSLHAVGESDGQSTYEVLIGGRSLGTYQVPLSSETFEEGERFVKTWPKVEINEGESLEIRAAIASADGKEYARARWARIVFTPVDVDLGKLNVPAATVAPASVAPVAQRQANGDASVTISGDLKQWHKVTLDLAGPFARELDLSPNPFTDYALNVTFTHESGEPSYVIPGYFAADGRAAESGASAGTVWRAHLSPDKAGTWTYTVSFFAGPNAATYHGGTPLAPYEGVTGSFAIAPTDKAVPDFRARGRLAYTGERYLRFAGDGTQFVKAGADAPETFLAYREFDNTIARKANVPLKDWAPHLRDWQTGDPTWQNGKGKGIIGALNYLSAKGANSFSFLTYNAGGDGDNVWPFVERDDKLHYDVSKLDQWEIVFAHAQHLGLYLHFKLQENELDDHRAGARRNPAIIPEAMDAGETGPERRLYFRELIARYGHHLALNWNFGEENTQSTEEQLAMFNFVAALDPYGHHRVIHTFPNQQTSVYSSLIGDQSNLTGISAQNAWNQTYAWTLKWILASANAGRPWVVANDEQNPAGFGVPADPGYEGQDGWAGSEDARYNLHGIRKYTLWGNLMAGGAGVEYYFGYRAPQNDLICEDLRSRDQSWDYCRYALTFFHDLKVDLNTLSPATGQSSEGNWVLSNPGELHVVYLPEGGKTQVKLPGTATAYNVTWFNPRDGTYQNGEPTAATESVTLTPPTLVAGEDWAAVLRRQ